MGWKAGSFPLAAEIDELGLEAADRNLLVRGRFARFHIEFAVLRGNRFLRRCHRKT